MSYVLTYVVQTASDLIQLYNGDLNENKASVLDKLFLFAEATDEVQSLHPGLPQTDRERQTQTEMVSKVVVDHVLRKISAATEQEAVRADTRIISLYNDLTSFKAQVELLQQMADLGVELREQKIWRKSVVCLACKIEVFSNILGIPAANRSKKFKNIVLKKFNELNQEIIKLKRGQYDLDAPSTPESCGSMADGYDPVLRMPAVEAELLGIGVAREKLISLLLGLDGEEQLKEVSIVGFAGLGKTTLAVEVYRRTREAFDCHAGATVSRNPDMKQLLRHILSQVRQQPSSPQCSEEMSLDPEQLIYEIREHLQDKR